MTIQGHRSRVCPLQIQDELAAQADSTAELLTSFADDAAKHHNIPLAAELDVQSLVFQLRAQFHRIVRRANTPETTHRSVRKEQ